MILNSMKPLVEIRMAGRLPPGDVWIFFGDYEQVKWWQWSDASVEIAILETSPVSRIDLRPLVGLKVCVQADRYSDALLRLCDRLKEYAKQLDVFVLEWMPGELGFRWDRGEAEYSPIAPKVAE